jgi:transposase
VKPTDRDKKPNPQELDKQLEQLQSENARLKREIERLREELAKALRLAKRQAAPFSRGEPKAKPKRPGRKPGARYGAHQRRNPPSHIDETIAVPMPQHCSCGGAATWERTQTQFQEDIVISTVRRRFDIDIGRCACCGRTVQGRDARQTSGALGAASVQIGPAALSLAALMMKQMGLSVGNAQQILEVGCGLRMSRGGLSRALARMARKAEPVYAQLLAANRASVVNVMDETGWKVGGRLQWAHVAVGDRTTVYAILPGRGYAQSVELIGADYSGFLLRDGWAPYRRFVQAFHQTCLGHLLRRTKEMEKAGGAAAGFPRSVKELLKRALRLRDRNEAGSISEHGLASARGQLEAAMDRLLEQPVDSHADRKLARHLSKEREHLFPFLYCPGLEATNHQAERAIRWLVSARKVWGGNRTAAGARTQAVLMSVLRTCRQQGQAPMPWLMSLLCAAEPLPLNLTG